MQVQLTEAGQNLFDAEPNGVSITRIDFGDGFNYALPAEPEGLTGEQTYQSHVATAPVIIDANTIKYVVLLGKSIASFQFGEVALYNEGTLVGVGVNPTLISKVGPEEGSDGQQLSISLFFDLQPGQRYVLADVEQIGNAFPTVSVPDMLFPPGKNSNNAYVINGVTIDAIPYFAFADPTGKWSFSSKPVVLYEGTVLESNALGMSAEFNEDEYSGEVTDLVLQFISGRLRGYCRVVTNLVVGDGAIQWNTPLGIIPAAGDAFIILGPIQATAPSDGSPIQFQDEGSDLGTAGTVTTLDFVGEGVTATRNANKVTVTVPGGAGGAGGFYFQVGIVEDPTHIHIANLTAAQAATLVQETSPDNPPGSDLQPTVEVVSAVNGPDPGHTHTLTVYYDWIHNTFVVSNISNNEEDNHEAFLIGTQPVGQYRGNNGDVLVSQGAESKPIWSPMLGRTEIISVSNKFTRFFDNNQSIEVSVDKLMVFEQPNLVTFDDYTNEFYLNENGVYDISVEGKLLASNATLPEDKVRFRIGLQAIDNIDFMSFNPQHVMWVPAGEGVDGGFDSPNEVSFNASFKVCTQGLAGRKFVLATSAGSYGNDSIEFSFIASMKITKVGAQPFVQDYWIDDEFSTGSGLMMYHQTPHNINGTPTYPWLPGEYPTNDEGTTPESGLVLSPGEVTVEEDVGATAGAYDAFMTFRPDNFPYFIDLDITVPASHELDQLNDTVFLYARRQLPLVSGNWEEGNGTEGENYASATFTPTEGGSSSWSFPAIGTGLNPQGAGTGTSGMASGNHTLKMEVRETDVRFFLNGDLMETCTLVDNGNPWDEPGQCGFGIRRTAAESIKVTRVRIGPIMQ